MTLKSALWQAWIMSSTVQCRVAIRDYKTQRAVPWNSRSQEIQAWILWSEGILKKKVFPWSPLMVKPSWELVRMVRSPVHLKVWFARWALANIAKKSEPQLYIFISTLDINQTWAHEDRQTASRFVRKLCSRNFPMAWYRVEETYTSVYCICMKHDSLAD